MSTKLGSAHLTTKFQNRGLIVSLSKELNLYYDTLTEFEQTILNDRYENHQSHKIIANKLGLSRSYIQEIELKSIRKLQHEITKHNIKLRLTQSVNKVSQEITKEKEERNDRINTK